MKLAPEQINELVRLDDDALVSVEEAAAYLGYTVKTLNYYRLSRPHCSPKFQRVGSRSIRYRMGDLRAFATRDPAGFHAPRKEA